MVPPVTLRSTLPFDSPHAAGVVVAVATNCAGWLTVAVTITVQPLPSVTVTVYVEAHKPVMVNGSLPIGPPLPTAPLVLTQL